MTGRLELLFAEAAKLGKWKTQPSLNPGVRSLKYNLSFGWVVEEINNNVSGIVRPLNPESKPTKEMIAFLEGYIAAKKEHAT